MCKLLHIAGLGTVKVSGSAPLVGFRVSYGY